MPRPQKMKSTPHTPRVGLSSSNIVHGSIDSQYFYTDSQLEVLVGKIFDYVIQGHSLGAWSSAFTFFLGLVISFAVTLSTSSFQPSFGFSAETLQGFAVAVLLFSAIATLISGVATAIIWFCNRKHHNRAHVVKWGTGAAKENLTTVKHLSDNIPFK